MTYLLKNKNLEIQIEPPGKGYQAARFDWTGKITAIKFQNIPLCTVERKDSKAQHLFGKGLFNEFGIETPVGFEETEIGGWFHKIGIGLLKKEGPHYSFSHDYEIKPAEFKVDQLADRLLISCTSNMVLGYAYLLAKEIELHESGFTLHYQLKNTGEKDIRTNEYVHNFMAIHNDLVGPNYKLKLPFQLNPELFEETVNPEGIVHTGKHGISFSGAPENPFFFSHLNGKREVEAAWKLTHLNHKIGIRESGSFPTTKVNLWGWRHVISPELFFKVHVKPGQTVEWSRTYAVFRW